MSSAATPTGSNCPSCGANRHGRYCCECGERFISPRDFELRHFLLEELPHEFLHVDGKLPRTLRLLFMQPGALAKNHVAGRRQPFIAPIRIYLFLFLVQVVVGTALSGPGSSFLDRVHDTDPFGVLARLMSYRPSVDWRSLEVAAHVRQLGHWLSELGTLFIFLGVAGVQQLLFYRLHRRYLEHVALALNVASFFLAALLLCDLLLWTVARTRYGLLEAQVQSLLAVTALPAYWYLALRRFYDLKALPAAGATFVIALANAVMALGLTTIAYAILIATA
jgi:hypothetical protein